VVVGGSTFRTFMRSMPAFACDYKKVVDLTLKSFTATPLLKPSVTLSQGLTGGKPTMSKVSEICKLPEPMAPRMNSDRSN
jgi:hypothetical protein